MHRLSPAEPLRAIEGISCVCRGSGYGGGTHYVVPLEHRYSASNVPPYKYRVFFHTVFNNRNSDSHNFKRKTLGNGDTASFAVSYLAGHASPSNVEYCPK